MRLACLAPFVLACASHAIAGATATNWPLQYGDKSTNEFVWDKRTQPMLASKLHQPFARTVLKALGGPPGPVIVMQKRFFSSSACVPHSCMQKGFFCLDTQSGEALGAVLVGHYPGPDSDLSLDSRSMRGELPESARQSIIDWLAETGFVPSFIAFTDATGVSRSLPPANFAPPTRFIPAEGGPSFDCALANTAVEHAICNAPALAAQDLKLAELYRQMLSGLDTLPYKKQLTDLQRDWIKQRDAACRAVSDMTPCLAAQYLAQGKRLQNWIPARPVARLTRSSP